MHRRQFLGTVGTAVGSVALTDPERVADLVRRRTASNVDDLTLEDMELTVDHLVQQVAVRPHHELYPLAARNWTAAERLLDGWQSLSHRRRLVDLASQLAYYVGHLHFNAGRYAETLQFARLTHRYAAETDNLVLRHSAAALQSSVAFFHGGNHQRSARIIERASEFATGYTRARGFACAARAYSALGDNQATVAALGEMRATVVELPAQPGLIPFTQASAVGLTAGCYRRLGDNSSALPLAREALATYEADSNPALEELSHARVGVALILSTGSQPEPDESVALGNDVLTSRGLLTDTVFMKLAELRESLHPWRQTPDVAVLRDAIEARIRLHLA
jgi:tetratricopeptide (TPR) repeat protein